MGYTACMKRSAWESMAEWWDKEASDTGTLHQRTDIDPVIWKLIGSVRDRRILEIGCGTVMDTSPAFSLDEVES